MRAFFIAAIAIIGICVASISEAAEAKNPSTPLAQPVGAVRFYTQHELRMLDTYRIKADPRRLDYLQMGGDAGTSSAGGSGDAGTGAGPGNGCR